MRNESILVGVWTTRTEYHFIPDSAATLVFKSDGNGWLKVSNDYTWEINFFHWASTSPGWIVLTGIKRLEPHIHTRKTIEVQPTFEIEHLSYKVHQTSEQLQIDWPKTGNNSLNLSENLFDLENAAADSQKV